MPPFSQLGLHQGYSKGIDRDFNPILHYIDKIDCHFSNRHYHLMNCFILYFDLKEDTCFYYLYSEIPRVKAEDITIEPHDSYTLVIYRPTYYPSSGHTLLSLGGKPFNSNTHSALPLT